MRALTILLLYILTFFIGGCDMQINNPQVFDSIKEINGELIKPKLIPAGNVQAAAVQLDAIIWRDKDADEYHLPSALIDENGKVLLPHIRAYGDYNPALTQSSPMVFMDLKTVQTFLPPAIIGANANVIMSKIVDIGDWNMDLTANIWVALDVTPANVRSIEVVIRGDNGENLYHLNGHMSGNLDGYYYYQVNTDALMMYRVDARQFDNAGFSTTPYNRGWITVGYVG